MNRTFNFSTERMAAQNNPLVVVIESNVRGRKSEVLNSLCEKALIPMAGCFEQPNDSFTNFEKYNLLLEYFNRDLSFVDFQNAVMLALAHRDICALHDAKRAGRAVVVLERSFATSLSFALAEHHRYGITESQLYYLSIMADLLCTQNRDWVPKDAQVIYLDSPPDYEAIKRRIGMDARDGEMRWVESKDQRWFEQLQQSQYKTLEQAFGRGNVHYVDASKEIPPLSLAQSVGALITHLVKDHIGKEEDLQVAKMILPSLNGVDVRKRKEIRQYFARFRLTPMRSYLSNKIGSVESLSRTSAEESDEELIFHTPEQGPPPPIGRFEKKTRNEEEKMELLRKRMDLLSDIKQKLVFDE